MEKKYTYVTRIKQPQAVAGVKLAPKGGLLTEREIKTLKKDVYGASLIEKRLLLIAENIEGGSGDTIPDFDETESREV